MLGKGTQMTLLYVDLNDTHHTLIGSVLEKKVSWQGSVPTESKS